VKLGLTAEAEAAGLLLHK
jgi:hypothetical protein